MKHILLILALATITSAASAQEIQSNDAAMAAKQDIERAGYRDVRGLARDNDGVWHGRALKGSTEVQLLVEEDGAVWVNTP